MNGLLLTFTWLTPLLAAPFALNQTGPRLLLALAALPALVTAIVVPAGAHWEVSWFLLGAQFGLDAANQVFLLFTALLWLFAGLQADLTMRNDSHWGRFSLFFLCAMAGNFWLIVGHDLVSFYLGFALMGIAAYALVIHNGDSVSLRAGRVYLAMTLLAEVALFAAFVIIFRHTQSLAPAPEQLVGTSNWAIGLLVLGLGIKAGLILLHVWLPLAHPAAPVPASAVLSGTMIKAALIGWMRFMPLGQETLWEWGHVLTIAGMVTVLYAIPVGLVQTNPKVVLAYSSVGKMGLMTAIVGLALMSPALAPTLLTALIFYAAHHGLAKGALFLGVGVARGVNASWMILVLVIPALALAGAPYTSGAMAKALLKPPLTELEGLWADAMPLLLITSTIGTTLLMARFLALMSADRRGASNTTLWIAAPWSVLIGIIVALPLLTDFVFPPITDSWPLAAGAALALLVALAQPRWSRRMLGSIPAGDVLEPCLHLSRRSLWWLADSFTRGLGRLTNAIPQFLHQSPTLRSLSTPSLELALRAWPVAGTVALSIGGALLLLLWTLP